MFFKPSSFSTTNLFYLTSIELQLTESSAHRLDRCHEFYNPIIRNCFLCWLNATSNIRAKSGTNMKLYTPSFYDNFYGKKS